MKKIVLIVFAAVMTSCGNGEWDEVYSQYEQVSAAKGEKKKDINFLIHNDHYQKGKEETK